MLVYFCARPAAAAIALLACVAMSRAAGPITDFTTSPGWMDNETTAQVLTSITVGGDVYSTPQFATTTATSAVTHLWGLNASDPGGAIAAITDNRLDTGVLGAGIGVDFDLGGTLATDDQIFVFYNGSDSPSFYEQPTSVSAFDSGGTMIGSTVVLPTLDPAADLVGRLDAARSGGQAALTNRAIYGIGIDPADFGATIGDIATINFAGPASTDFQMVGFATLGAILTDATWDATGGGSWGVAGNWNINSVPANLNTTFGTAINSSANVTLDGSRTTGDLTFDSPNAYTISGSDALTVNGAINVLQGSHTISAPLQLSGGERTLTSSAGASMNVTGVVSTPNDAAATFVLDGAGGGTIGAIRDNEDVLNELNGTDNISVIKRGAGVWTIGPGTTTAEDFYGGNTTIEAGTLRVNGTGSDGELRSPVITIRDGATLDTSEFGEYTVQIDQRIEGAGTIDTGAGNLRVSGTAVVSPGDNGPGVLNVDGDMSIAAGLGGSGGRFEFQLSESTVSGNDQIAVSGNLVTNAGSGSMAVSVTPVGTLLSAGSYELFTASSVTGSASDFSLDSSLNTRFTQAISVDADSVNLDITGSNASLVWRGNNGANPTRWDVDGTSNWDNGGSSDVFLDLDSVTFDDTAVGTTVDVQATVTPAVVNFNNSTKDIEIIGAGAIAGGAVNKSGAGRVILGTTNTYTGVTSVTGGVLQPAADGALGSTEAGTVVNGGTLDITGADVTGETVSIQGAGSDGRGALITDGFDSLGGGTQQISNVIQTGDATIGAYAPDQPADAVFARNDYRWDLEPGGGVATATWAGNGHNLTKKGRGAVSIQGVGDMNIASLNIEQGIFFVQGSTTANNAAVTVGNGADAHVTEDVATGSAEFRTFHSSGQTPAPPTSFTNDITLQGGAFIHENATTDALTLNGTIVQNDVTGDETIDNRIGASGSGAGTASLVLPQAISGTGDLLFFGDGIGATGGVELQANNTYTGRTEVEGRLILTGSGALSATPSITLTGDGNIDVTGSTSGALTIGAGRRITSNVNTDDAAAGRVTGNLVVQSGGVLEVNSGAGETPPATTAFLQNTNTIGAGAHRFIAFEAESFTELVTDDGAMMSWSIDTTTDGNGADGDAPLGGQTLVATGADPTFSSGNDDQVRYDMVFTEPGEYFWYLRTSAPNGGADSFFGPNTDPSSANPFVTPQSNTSRFGVSDELLDAEGGTGISTAWDWLRSDPDAASQGSFVDFEKVIVTQDDVDNEQVFSISFEPRQADARLDKMVLVASEDFDQLTDADLDAVLENATSVFQPAPVAFNFLVDGDLTLESGSTLELDIRGLNDFDALDVTGAADLAGSLAVNLDGFTPTLNDTFTVLSADGLLADSGLSVSAGFSHAIVGNDLVLTFVGGALIGDYNGDGQVDAADYTVYRDNLGGDGSTLLNRDPANAGVVGPDDYASWAANYGAAAPSSSAAVPEPTGLLLLVAAGALSVGRRR